MWGLSSQGSRDWTRGPMGKAKRKMSDLFVGGGVVVVKEDGQ